MNAMILLRTLSYLIILTLAFGTHFRGAIFTWISNSDGTSVSVSWRISWRRSYSDNLFCNDTTIASGFPITGAGNLVCFEGCSDTISSLLFLCTDYSDDKPDDWTTGTYGAVYSPQTLQFSIGFSGCCWISNLNVGNDSSWSLVSTVDLSLREDTGKINTSPTVDLPPILHLQFACSYTIQLPVADVDGDVIRCRWASTKEECDGICNVFPSQASLNLTACTLTYRPQQQLGYYAAAIQIEDFATATSQTPLSSIPLQFLVNVYSGSDCNDVPTFIAPSPDDKACFAVDVGQQFSVTIKARNSQPLRRITTLSGVGMVRSNEIFTQDSSYYYIELTVTWMPTENDAGKDHRLCYYATDTRRITGNVRCVQIPVSVVGPTPLRVERVGITNTWIIVIDQTFSRPTEPAYLHVFETDTNTEIFSVDASTSPDVVFDTDTKQVKVSFSYNFDIDRDYHVTIPSGFVKGHVGCGALSVPVDDSSFWTVEIDCGVLKIANGIVDAPNGTVYPNSITYSCNIGFDLIGNDTRTCTSNGTWTGEEPFCQIRDCGPFTMPAQAGVSTNATEYNTTVTFYCKLGYELSGGASIYCDHTPAWNSTPPACILVDCGNPPPPMHGSVSTSDGTSYDKLAIYSCNEGYDIVGNQTRQCQQSKMWSASVPVCSPKDCGTLTAPANGNISLEMTTFGNTATYFCDDGYLVLGSNIRKCLANGTWSFNDPTCVIADCPPLQSPDNGSLFVSYGNNSELVGTFNCEYAFRIIGSSFTRCQQNGSWTSSEPDCVLINCGMLEAPQNGNLSITGTRYLDSATFSCDTGHDLNGSSFRQCWETNTWSGESATCVPYDCGNPQYPENGKAVYNLTTFGSEAFFLCNGAFEIQGLKSTFCTANRTWSVSTTTCKEKANNDKIKLIAAASGGGGALLLIAVVVTAVVIKTRRGGTPSRTASDANFFDNDKKYVQEEAENTVSLQEAEREEATIDAVEVNTYENVARYQK